VEVNVVDDIVEIEPETTIFDSALSNVGADIDMSDSSGYSGGLVCQLEFPHDCMSHESLSNTTSSVDVGVVNVACDINGEVETDTLFASSVDDTMSVSVKNGYSGGLVCQLDLFHDCTSHMRRSNVTVSTPVNEDESIEGFISLDQSNLFQELASHNSLLNDRGFSVIDIPTTFFVDVFISLGVKNGYSGGLVCQLEDPHVCLFHMSLSNVKPSAFDMLEILTTARLGLSVMDTELSISVLASDRVGSTYGVSGGDCCHSNESYSSSFQMPPSNIYITHPHPRYP
jgi:hypothetical protein